jgi:membrane protein YdbS with pleckstrin-like domain
MPLDADCITLSIKEKKLLAESSNLMSEHNYSVVDEGNARMETIQAATDPAQHDLTWTGYHPRAMAPAIGLAAVASLVVWTGRWYLEDLSVFTDRVGTLVVFILAWAVWPALVAVFLYRTVTYTYRLTDRALLTDFGFLSPPVSPVALTEVTGVAISGGWLTRQFGVGWVEVRTRDRAVRLRGVRKPELFALAIRETVGKAKAGT